jgi:hypothetical protein
MLITAEKMPDGTVVPRQPPPEPCAACGAVREQIIVVIQEVVAVHKEHAQTG